MSWWYKFPCRADNRRLGLVRLSPLVDDRFTIAPLVDSDALTHADADADAEYMQSLHINNYNTTPKHRGDSDFINSSSTNIFTCKPYPYAYPYQTSQTTTTIFPLPTSPKLIQNQNHGNHMNMNHMNTNNMNMMNNMNNDLSAVVLIDSSNATPYTYPYAQQQESHLMAHRTYNN